MVMKEDNMLKEENKEISKEPKKSKKGKSLLILILILIAIGIGLYVGFQKLNSNPRSIYKKAINNTYKLLDSYLENNLDTAFKLDIFNEPFLLDTNFKINSTISELGSLNNYEYNFAIGLDYQKESLNLKAGINQDHDSVINVLLAFLNNKAYLKSNEIFDKTLDLGNADVNFDLSALNTNAKIDYDNLHTILSLLKDILISSLDEEKFNISKEIIKINDEQIESQKVTYLLDQENMERTLNYIADEISKNEELLDALTNVSSISKEEIISNLEEEIKLNNYEEIVINLYTKSNKIIAGNILMEEENIIRFTNLDDKLQVLMEDDYSSIELNYEDEVLELLFNEYDEEIVAIKLKMEAKEKLIELRTSEYGTNETFKIEINNIKDQKDEWQADLVFEYEVEEYGDVNNIEIIGSININKTEINDVDPLQSVDYNNLTKEEQKEITNNLTTILKKLGLTDISSEINSKF